jgi:kexin
MYGFGKIDTYRIVEMAKNYTLVNPQTSIESKWSIVNQTIPHGNYGINNTIVLTEAEIAIHGFQKLEHITVTADITHQRRGDIEVYLISPLNIVSKLSAMRRSDESNEGFRNWTFMTVKHW